ncbi:MAG: (Fe-S)-binding protein [Actinomycetota bacterium]|nr:(Fe-S)-binding protein [Actinomycetota bacterium]
MTATEEKVLFFPTCLADLLFPDAARAAKSVLERVGCKVTLRPGAVCCGQPAWNSGHVPEARRVAVGALRALEGTEPVVLCSGSCATMMHEYWPELFEGTEHADGAEAVAQRVHEFSSFVAGRLGAGRLGPGRLGADDPGEQALCYHDSCHMLRGLGIKDAPHSLLDKIEGVEVRPLDAPERCCGFGGTFSLRYPELSAAMADEKVDDVIAKDVATLVAADLGCLMQICGRAEARGIALRGRYIAEVVEAAMDDGTDAT